MTAPEPTLTAVDALGVVEQWLDDDEEMRIPGNEWGTRLYEALKDVVRSAREPGAEPALVSEVRRLTEESERLKRGGAELGRILDRTLTMALDASGRHDVIEEDGDGDWEIVWETLAGLRPRAESAEAEVVTLRAKVAAVESLADEWADRKRSDGMSGNAWIGLTLSGVAADLRVALGDEPTIVGSPPAAMVADYLAGKHGPPRPEVDALMAEDAALATTGEGQ